MTLDRAAEYCKGRRAQAFDAAMARMAADPAIKKECAAIAREFSAAEADSLREEE